MMAATLVTIAAIWVVGSAVLVTLVTVSIRVCARPVVEALAVYRLAVSERGVASDVEDRLVRVEGRLGALEQDGPKGHARVRDRMSSPGDRVRRSSTRLRQNTGN